MYTELCVFRIREDVFSAIYDGQTQQPRSLCAKLQMGIRHNGKTRDGEYFPIGEDGRGTYILNSKDLNMSAYIPQLADAGITSFKIEGRMKSSYYVAGVVNAYRRALDLYYSTGNAYSLPREVERELEMLSHRMYGTGFYLGEKGSQCLETSKPEQKEYLLLLS